MLVIFCFKCFFSPFLLLFFFIDWEFSAFIISHIINSLNRNQKKKNTVYYFWNDHDEVVLFILVFVFVLFFSIQSPSAHVYDAFNVSVKAMQIMVPVAFFVSQFILFGYFFWCFLLEKLSKIIFSLFFFFI